MPAGNWIMYTQGEVGNRTGVIDLDTDDFNLVLVTTAYSPNQTTHFQYSDISGSEVSGTGYTAGGENVTISVSVSGEDVVIDCSDVSLAGTTLSNVKYAIITRRAGASPVAGDRLLCYCDLEVGGSLSTTNGTFSITMDAAGIINVNLATS